jgi:hypothetical protein
MSERPTGLAELVATLARHEVDFTVIGGVAVQVHGHRRTTMDLDVVAARRPDNHRRLVAALTELAARPRDIHGAPAPTAEQLAAPIVPPLVTRHGELHILNDVPGAPEYAQLRARALEVDFAGTTLAVAGLDDLIAMKRAAGREVDRRDIAALTARPADR